MAENSDSQRKNSQKRRGPGRPFQPGQTGNAGGRPKGFAALVRERTEEGAQLVDFALRVHSGEEFASHETGKEGAEAKALTVRERVEITKVRLDAGKWLADRGWGAPMQQVEHSGEGGGPMVVELVRYDGKEGA